MTKINWKNLEEVKKYKNKYHNEWEKRNPDKVKKYQQKTYSKNFDKNKEKRNLSTKKWKKGNPNYYKEWAKNNRNRINTTKREWLKKNPDYLKEENKRIRKIVIFHYSKTPIPECNCCKTIFYDHLSIDHINGGGNKHIKEIGGSLYRWIIRNNFPTIFQILCMSCNFAKGHYGKCNCQSILPLGTPNLLELCKI